MLNTPHKQSIKIYDLNGFMNFSMCIFGCSAISSTAIFVGTNSQLLTLGTSNILCEILNLNNNLYSTLITHV